MFYSYFFLTLWYTLYVWDNEERLTEIIEFDLTRSSKSEKERYLIQLLIVEKKKIKSTGYPVIKTVTE